MSTTAVPMNREQVGKILDGLRDPLVRSAAARAENQFFTVESLGDVYSNATVVLLSKDPFPVFEHHNQVYEFMRLTMNNVIRDQRKWHARHPEMQLLDDADLDATAQEGGSATYGHTPRELIDFDDPETETQLNNERNKVSEWATTLCEADVPLALLMFHPDSFATPKDIAKRLGKPLEGVQKDVRRLRKGFYAYMDDANEAKICASQRARAQDWILTGGRMPLGLKFHTRRCANCERALVAFRRQRTEVYSALLPLAGAVLPADGAYTVLQHGAAHPTVQKLSRVFPSIRKAGPVVGGGGVAVVAKSVATPAVLAAIAAGAIGAGAVVLNSGASSPPRRTATTAPVVRATSVARTTALPKLQPTTASPRKRPARRHHKHRRRSERVRTTPVPTAPTTPIVTAQTQTQTQTTAPAAATVTAKPERTATVTSTQTTTTAQQQSGGALPSAQQAQDAP